MSHLRNLVAAAALGLYAAAASAAYTGLYIFGDSLSDSGNIAIAVGADPSQVISGNSYIPSRPYASGQFTNGDVWAKTFAGAIGLASFGQPSLAGGGNFAFGGARVDTDGIGLPPSLQTQADLFLMATGGTAPGSALYVVAGGGNDARDALLAAATAAAMMLDPTAGIAAAAAAYAAATGDIIDQLQAAGAHDIVVWDVPDIGLAPAVAAGGAGAVFLGNSVSQAMNAALSARLASESDVLLFDLFGLQHQLVADPAAYGLVNVTDACGAPMACDPATGLSWDGIHPTAAAHALIAREMLTLTSPVAAIPEPAEYALMAVGLMLLRLRARRRA